MEQRFAGLARNSRVIRRSYSRPIFSTQTVRKYSGDTKPANTVHIVSNTDVIRSGRWNVVKSALVYKFKLGTYHEWDGIGRLVTLCANSVGDFPAAMATMAPERDTCLELNKAGKGRAYYR